MPTLPIQLILGVGRFLQKIKAASTNSNGFLMFKTGFQAEKVHSLVFDGASFFGNVVLFGSLPRLGDEVDESTAGFLVLLAVLTQIAGAWWKKGFLAQRLTHRVLPPSNGLGRGFMNILLFLHFLLFSVMAIFAFALLGIYEISGSASFYKGDIWIIVGFVVGGFATFLVQTAEQRPEVNARAKNRPPWLEFGADGLLWVSVSLVTRIFWDGLVGLIEPSRGIGISGQGIVLLVAVSFLYVFFYLPGRYLFLVEDYQSVLTWVQVGIVMLPVVWLVIIG